MNAGATTATDSLVAGKVTVTPGEFRFVQYDAAEIAELTSSLAERLGVANPIHVIVDETTPLGKVSAEIDGASSDATIVVRAESGALENTKRMTTFGRDRAEESIGRMLLRARDRMRPDFADAPADVDLSLTENAAWDTYCAARLERLGMPSNQQRWRYNYRNRFGFADHVDAAFDRLWSADDLSFADVVAAPAA